MVKKISASLLQCIDIAMFQGGHCKVRVANVETTEGCPINPGSSFHKVHITYFKIDIQVFHAKSNAFPVH